jgi:DNA-binding HxlR family transcriptional regulator
MYGLGTSKLRKDGLSTKVANPLLVGNGTLFIGKLMVKIMYSLEAKPHHHEQLRRRLGNVSQRMPIRTLRNLESTGLIARKVMRSKSVAVEYSLTKLGRTFITPLNGICRRANRHKKELGALRAF